MSLSGKLAFQIDRAAQFKGLRLWQSGAVRLTTVEPRHVHADVMGSQLYEVCLQYLYSDLVVACGCKYFQDRGACKHIWATILEADNRGALREAAAQRGLNLLEAEPEETTPTYTRLRPLRRRRRPGRSLRPGKRNSATCSASSIRFRPPRPRCRKARK
jgi:uncharacterized Zn finger protein